VSGINVVQIDATTSVVYAISSLNDLAIVSSNAIEIPTYRADLMSTVYNSVTKTFSGFITTLTADKTTITANGTDVSTVTATVTDYTGVLATTLSGNVVFTFNGQQHTVALANGQAQTQFSSTTAGVFTLVGSVDGGHNKQTGAIAITAQ